jgi:hypothetical protein
MTPMAGSSLSGNFVLLVVTNEGFEVLISVAMKNYIFGGITPSRTLKASIFNFEE